VSTSFLGNPTNLDPNQTATAFDRGQVMFFHFDYSTPDFLEVYGSTARIRYRQVGTTPWTTSSDFSAGGSTPSVTTNFPANTFAALTYEWQAQITDNNGGITDWSASAFFAMAATPTAPVITAPAAGASITGGSTSLTWTLTTQVQYRVQVKIGGINGAVEYDSGAINQSATRAHTTPLPEPGGRTLVLSTQSTVGGPWSVVSRDVTAAGATPPVPTIGTAAAVDASPTLGIRWAIQVAVSGLSASSPNAATVELYVRPVGSSDATGTKVATATNSGGSATLSYFNLPQGSWQIRVKALASDGRNSTTAWTTLTVQPNLTGVVLNYPTADALSATDGVARNLWLRLNDEGAVESVEPVAELLRYVGRKAPAVEWDATAEDRTYQVGKVTIKTADVAQWTMLRGMLRSREPVCVRDKRGRRIIGLLKVGSFKDVAHGWELDLAVTETDYPDLLVVT
jgi:hypothetical protein